MSGEQEARDKALIRAEEMLSSAYERTKDAWVDSRDMTREEVAQEAAIALGAAATGIGYALLAIYWDMPDPRVIMTALERIGDALRDE